jgi:hypothetical protein
MAAPTIAAPEVRLTRRWPVDERKARLPFEARFLPPPLWPDRHWRSFNPQTRLDGPTSHPETTNMIPSPGKLIETTNMGEIHRSM